MSEQKVVLLSEKGAKVAVVKKQRHYLHMTKISVLSIVFDGNPDGNEWNKDLLMWLVDLIGSWSRSRQNWSKSKEVDVICSRSKNEQR